MQTYVFMIAITGEDVQDRSESLRDGIIQGLSQTDQDVADIHVTESVRVTPG